MRETLKKLIFILPRSQRPQAILLLLLGILAALVQAGGIASIMPFMAVLASPEVIETNPQLNWVYEYFAFTSAHRFLLALGFLVLFTVLAGIAVQAFHEWLSLRFGHLCGFKLSQRLLIHYLRRPYPFFLTRNTSDLIKNIFSEVNQVVAKGLKPAMDLAARTITAIAILSLLVLADPVLALSVTVILGVLYGLIYLAVRGRLVDLGDRRMAANSERFSAAYEAFGGIKDIKLLGREDLYTRRFSEPALKTANYETRLGLIAQMPRYALEALAFGGMILIALYLLGTSRDLQQALPLLALYAFAGYRLMPVLHQIFHSVSSLRSTGPVVNNLCQELEYLSASDDSLSLAAGKAKSTKLPVADRVSLENVTFNYPDTKEPVLKNFTLEIPAGSRIGLVGTTGAGKTTVIDLLLGLLRPTAGHLLVDGRPVTEELVRQWQNGLGYVSQQIYLADDTVARNIAFGVPDDEIDFEAVEKCARIAQIHDFIQDDFPHHYQTVVGERGIRLSGGQRQRLGIARALYQCPHLLILDEATSALDSVTEAEVMKGIESLSGNTTIVMIAHRLTTVRSCDRIYLLEKGVIVASGAYEDLVTRNKQFRSMAAVTPLSESP